MKRSREANSSMIYGGLAAAIGVVLVSGYFIADAETPSSACSSISVTETGNLDAIAGVTFDYSGKSRVDGIIYNLDDAAHKETHKEVGVDPTDLQHFVSTVLSFPHPGKYDTSATLIVQNGQQNEELAPTSDCESRVAIS